MRSIFLKVALAVSLVAGMLVGAQAQNRQIAPTAKIGVMQMTVFPEARIDGKVVRFGAGARIFNNENRLVLPGSITAPSYVAYESDFQGLLLKVWLIDEAEARSLIEARRKANN